MDEIPFLRRLVKTLTTRYVNLKDVVVVLPSRRARIFFLEELRGNISGTAFAPEITSIEQFVGAISGLRPSDGIETLFEFYDVYHQLNTGDGQSFEIFANWAKTLLQDFNELDRYLLPPDHLLSYLRDIEDLKRWSLDPSEKTELISNYVKFWHRLPEYYRELYSHLKSKSMGYQGMVYREAVNNIDHFTQAAQGKKFVFAGFNALNAAEEKIIQHFLALGMADVFWDIDKIFLEDPQHDAGLFIRQFKRRWPHYQSNPFEWITNEFSAEKNIRLIGTPKSVGQARIAGDIIRKCANAGSLQRTAVVLGDENLLVPLLHTLPAEAGPLNITMGFPAKNNPAQILVAKLFRLHLNARARNAESYVFYFKDVVDVLTHPLVEPYVNATQVVGRIRRNNIAFITARRLDELHPESHDYFKLLFDRWDADVSATLDRIGGVLLEIKRMLAPESEQEKVTLAFVHAVFKVINKLKAYFSKHPESGDLQTLHAAYKQVVDLAEVSFEGEPLTGLQIMGVLESRTLDFDTVIVTSLNEGKFPAGKAQQTFIPYDVKREMGLPTFKEKDAIYTYHFYHLLQRAKNVYLIYNTESEGLDGGEKSRFITQLEVEGQRSHHITQHVYHADVPTDGDSRGLIVPKSERVIERLAELCESGFSPSALTSYIRNPVTFYFQRVLRISDAEEVEEDIAVNTLGTIIHGALEAIYRPLIGKRLEAGDLQDGMNKIEQEVLTRFREIYREGEIKKGRNLLAFEVAKRHVRNFLKMEMDQLEQFADEVEIIALEQRFERQFTHPSLQRPVLIGGSVDRVEKRNGRIRIVDYKTGRVEKGNIALKQWQGLTSDIKHDKIIQVLAYAFLFEPEAAGLDMEAGIISFKNMKAGFMPFVAPGGGSVIDPEILTNYRNELAVLLAEILEPSLPFVEATD